MRPPPAPPHALSPSAITNAQALVASSRLFMIPSPLKPLKKHGFPISFMVSKTFQFA
jgi:hypothetical protein